MAWKPEECVTAPAYLMARHAGATIALAKRVPGAELRRAPDDEGRLTRAQILEGNNAVLAAEPAPRWRPVQGHVPVCAHAHDVRGEDRVALEGGAPDVQNPDIQGDEDKGRGVRDGGTTWWMTTREA